MHTHSHACTHSPLRTFIRCTPGTMRMLLTCLPALFLNSSVKSQSLIILQVHLEGFGTTRREDYTTIPRGLMYRLSKRFGKDHKSSILAYYTQKDIHTNANANKHAHRHIATHTYSVCACACVTTLTYSNDSVYKMDPNQIVATPLEALSEINATLKY